MGRKGEGEKISKGKEGQKKKSKPIALVVRTMPLGVRREGGEAGGRYRKLEVHGVQVMGRVLVFSS